MLAMDERSRLGDSLQNGRLGSLRTGPLEACFFWPELEQPARSIARSAAATQRRAVRPWLQGLGAVAACVAGRRILKWSSAGDIGIPNPRFHRFHLARLVQYLPASEGATRSTGGAWNSDLRQRLPDRRGLADRNEVALVQAITWRYSESAKTMMA